MVFSRSSWRFLAVLAALCVLPLGLGCGGKTTASDTTAVTTVTVSGKVTFTRRPLVSDATTGVPLGLETDTAKFTSLPLRGVSVRAFQSKQETDANGNAVTVWKVVSVTQTLTDGTYSLLVPVGESTFVEVSSSMTPVVGSGVRVVGTSLLDETPVVDRPFYFLRKGADGGSAAGDLTPGSVIDANATVDFPIDLAKAWWVGPLASTITKTVITGDTPSTTWFPSGVTEATGTGSRVAAILDSAYTFGSVIGNPTPGAILSLHYLPNPADTAPSFIEYDLEAYAPTKSTNTYFGHIQGTTANNDDAFDEGVLFPLFARNWLVSQHFTSLLPTTPKVDRSDLQDLHPDMALLEGYSQAVAAVLLKSPYLADTNEAGLVSNRDIRDASGKGADAYSAANIAALAWKLNLYANGTLTGSTVTPVADTPTGWATLTQTALNRFFSVVTPKDTTTGYPTDIGSIYSQILRLQEGKASTDTVDLLAFFPTTTLTPLLAPFNITWPRPTTTATLPDPLVPDAGFMANWGADPDSTTKLPPAFTLSMAGAHKNGLDIYPNFSKGEAFFAQFTLTKDRTKLTLSGLSAGASVEVLVDGSMPPYIFTASGSQDVRTIFGPVPPATTAVLHNIQVRILSPGAILPDQTLTVGLDAQ